MIKKFFKELYLFIRFPSHQYWLYKDRYWTKPHVVKCKKLNGWTTQDRILSHHILQITENFIFKTCEADKNYTSEFINIQDHPDVPKMWEKLINSYKWLSENIDRDIYADNMDGIKRPKISFVRCVDTEEKLFELKCEHISDNDEELYNNALKQIEADTRRNEVEIQLALKDIIDCMWLMAYLS